jgi:hypothetical protein
VDEPKDLPALSSELRCIDSLQIGLGWFPENPGGLDRFFYNLIRHLPAEGVRVSGLVLGTVEGEIVPDCTIHSYARLSDSLASRLCSSRRAVKQAISQKRPYIICSHFAAFALPARGATPLCCSFPRTMGAWSSLSVDCAPTRAVAAA